MLMSLFAAFAGTAATPLALSIASLVDLAA
jgi:hypothetical protein